MTWVGVDSNNFLHVISTARQVLEVIEKQERLSVGQGFDHFLKRGFPLIKDQADGIGQGRRQTVFAGQRAPTARNKRRRIVHQIGRHLERQRVFPKPPGPNKVIIRVPVPTIAGSNLPKIPCRPKKAWVGPAGCADRRPRTLGLRIPCGFGAWNAARTILPKGANPSTGASPTTGDEIPRATGSGTRFRRGWENPAPPRPKAGAYGRSQDRTIRKNCGTHLRNAPPT
jgi:hypothetical protein